MPARRSLFLATAFLLLGGCSTDADAPESETPGAGGKADGIDEPIPAERPRRIILMIGDGMGVGSLTAAAYASGAPLHILGMPQVSFMTTHEHEFVTTDSAASATAIASGTKTHFEGVGIAPGTTQEDEEEETQQLTTVVDAAQARGWKTGLVTTTSLVDATPAAFAAHRAKRRSKEGIAQDLRHSGVDVMLGGGRDFFDDRDDGQNLLNQMRNSDGYSIAKTATGLRRASGSKTKVAGLLHEGDMPPVATGERAMELPEMVREAIEILDTQNDEGYLLVVEGAQIDRRGHELDGPGNVAETLDFDAAVAVALEYARGRDDTLVIVTADHETGGVTVLDAEAAGPMVEALGGREAALALGNFPNIPGPDAFSEVPVGTGELAPPESADPHLVVTHGDLSTASRPFFFGPTFLWRATHTPTMVPLFAEGTAARFVGRARDNAELGARVLALLQAEEDGEPESPAPDEAPRNVVVVLTDGVGLPGWTAAHYGRGTQAVETMGIRGLSATHAADRVLGDATSATSAWSTGALGLHGAGGDDALTSLLGVAGNSSRATGLVTTAAATDAAVASFFAPGAAGEAAQALAEFEPTGDGVDVVFAGGGADFDDTLVDVWIERGADVALQWDPQSAGDGPIVRLIADGALAPAAERAAQDQPSLGEMTDAAIERLDSHDEGFVLVVYAPGAAARLGELDFSEALLDEIADVDGAVAAALQFAANDGETLVVVSSTQDASMSIHDNHYGFHRGQCGVAARCDGPETLFDLAIALGSFAASAGFSDTELQGDFADLSVVAQGAWLPFRAQAAGGPVEVHSANFVPVFAHGPGASNFGGFQHQAGLGAALRDLL